MKIIIFLLWVWIFSAAYPSYGGYLKNPILKDKNEKNKTYYDNGKLKSQTVYQDNKIIHKTYFENGRLSSETYLSNQNSDIVQRQYNKQGRLLEEYIRKDGKVVKEKFYCQETMEQIFVQWFKTQEQLTQKPFNDVEFKEDELRLLEREGIRGTLEVRGVSLLQRECQPSRMVIIIQDSQYLPTDLSLPNKTAIIYLQEDNGWRKLPADALVLERKISLKEDQNNPHWILEMTELESGGLQGGGFSLQK